MPTRGDADVAAARRPAARGEDGAELFARIASSVVLAPAALAAAWIGGPVFAGVIAAGGVILAREWTRMTDPDGPDVAFALVGGGAAGATIAASAGIIELAWAWMAAMAAAAFVAAWKRGRAWSAGFGVIYASAPAACLVWLRLQGDPIGADLLTFLFACVWGADIGAYAAGRLVGGPLLLPTLSPKKTWAGLAGGVVLAVSFGAAASLLTGWRPIDAGLVAGAAALGAAGLAGDLFESALKRRYGVKDAGSLIPGHGGLFDRVDSLIVASVVLAAWFAVAGSA